MDNTRFDPMRFSPQDLPSLEQLLREQSYQNRADDDVMSDYPRPDPPMQPYPAHGYYAPQQDAATQPYAPYPYGVPPYGYARPDPMYGQTDPMQELPCMDRSFYPQPDPRGYMQTPYYGQHARETQMPQQGYTPYDPNYRPQHMKPETAYDVMNRYDDPRYGYAPQYPQSYSDSYAAPQYARVPQQPAPMAPRYAKQPVHDVQPVTAGEEAKAEPANRGFDTLPSLAQLQQALEDERNAQTAFRAQEAQRQEAQRAQQAARQPQSAPQPQQRPNPAPHAQEHHASAQPSQRFVIEDLALDGDEEDHTKKKDPLERTQFSSLLKRFRPRNN